MSREEPSELVTALKGGDPGKVAALVAAGADIHYRDENGYDALLDAVHGRDVARDPRLLELLRLLVGKGVALSSVSKYGESALRVLSRHGRFDALGLLLDAGADRTHLEWTPLMEAVARGTLADVQAAVLAGASLEERDYWERTAWLIAILAGDVAKAQLLLDQGARADVVGRCRHAPLAYAIDGHHPQMLRWLLARGADPEQTDEFGDTPLDEAAEQDDVECARILLAHGVDAHGEIGGTALEAARGREMVLTLLEAGADPSKLSEGGRRAVLGFPPDPDESLFMASPEDFVRASRPAFGRANPERRDEPFWLSMIRAGLSGYGGRQHVGAEGTPFCQPTWSAERFGQSMTFLPDGHIVQIAGEHEDWSDPDFVIYNDVFVHAPDGGIAIYTYPKADFPPTDFHTATLVGDFIYVIGSVGYKGTRRFGETPVFRLDVRTFRMERLAPSGQAPGWISRHRAALTGPREIKVWGGNIARLEGDTESHDKLAGSFVLNLDDLRWRQDSAGV